MVEQTNHFPIQRLSSREKGFLLKKSKKEKLHIPFRGEPAGQLPGEPTFKER
jgi:hypothetical protein